MIKTRTRFIDDAVIFNKDKTSFVKIPRDNPLRRISCDFLIKLVDGGVDATGAIQDGLLKFIKNIKLVRNGSDNKIDVDLKTYFYASTMQLGVQPSKTTLTDPLNADIEHHVSITFDFAKFKNDLGDLASLLNAPDLESLNLVIDWGSIDEIYTTVGGVTVDDTTQCNISIIEVYDDEGKVEELSGLLSNAIDYLETVETFTVDKENNSFPGSQQTEKIQPVPHIHEISTFVTSLNTGDRSDDIIDVIKIANVTSGGETIFIDRWRDLKRRMKADFALDTAILGVVSLDWDTLRRGGLRVIEDDAIKWFFQTQAPTASQVNEIKLYKKTYAVGV